MLKRNILIIVLLCPFVVFGQKEGNKNSRSNDIISSFLQLSTQQLFDTAEYFYNKQNYDTAYISYRLFINSIPKNAEFEQQMKLSRAYSSLNQIYFLKSDYRMSYDCIINRLLIAEKYDLADEKFKCYVNLGLVYKSIKQYDVAKQYYFKALDLVTDSVVTVTLLNNIAALWLSEKKRDSAYFYLNKAISKSKNVDDVNIGNILGNFALYYQAEKLYDSAFYFFRRTLDQAKKEKSIYTEMGALSMLGKLFFEKNKIDSSLYYIELSNRKAMETKSLNILLENYLTLSEIEKSKGKHEKALEHYVAYSNLSDSIYHAGIYGSINLYQRQYEVSKTNQQIEELEIDRRIKERTIKYQKIIFGILLLFFAASFTAIYLKKKLKKYSKININEKTQKELLNKILSVMENVQIICDPDFTIDKLAELVQSNYVYVSHIINNVIKKNFRTLLNSYRIKEAKRLLLEPNAENYTIESFAQQVGFKSRSAFYKAFKEIVGESPKEFLKFCNDGNGSTHGAQ